MKLDRGGLVRAGRDLKPDDSRICLQPLSVKRQSVPGLYRYHLRIFAEVCGDLTRLVESAAPALGLTKSTVIVEALSALTGMVGFPRSVTLVLQFIPYGKAITWMK